MQITEINKQKTRIPIYLQIAENLRDRILNREFLSGTFLPSEAELAASFKVNHLTLRKGLKVLRDQNLIIQQQGRGNFVTYEPQQELRIGFVCQPSTIEHERYTSILLSILIKQLMNGRGNIILISNDGKTKKEVLEQVIENRCSGLIFPTYSKKSSKLFLSEELSSIPSCLLSSSEIPVKNRNLCTIGLKPGQIFKAAEYLLALNHKRVAYISYEEKEFYNLTERNREFFESNIPEKLIYIGKDGIPWRSFAKNVMYQIAAMPAEQRPTAVMCSGIAFAAGAWIGALEAGLKIPQDISLISIDSDLQSFPEMTAIEQPREQFIEKCISLLNEAVLSGGLLKPERYIFESTIVERGSCRAI